MPTELVVLSWGLPAAALLLGIGLQRVTRRRRVRMQRTLHDLRKLTWEQFEEVIADAFRRHGYRVIEVGGRGRADGGVDVVLMRHGETTVVQAKHWRDHRISVQLVRELYGVQRASRATRSMFVSTTGYTADARRFAADVGMVLVDGEELVAIISAGLAGEPLVLPTPELSGEPVCPGCGGPMVRRTARRGPHAGEEFFGCERFPACRGTVALPEEAPTAS
jgi:restriction system protein